MSERSLTYLVARFLQLQTRLDNDIVELQGIPWTWSQNQLHSLQVAVGSRKSPAETKLLPYCIRRDTAQRSDRRVTKVSHVGKAIGR